MCLQSKDDVVESTIDVRRLGDVVSRRHDYIYPYLQLAYKRTSSAEANPLLHHCEGSSDAVWTRITQGTSGVTPEGNNIGQKTAKLVASV
jgi:hypothetical protein